MTKKSDFHHVTQEYCLAKAEEVRAMASKMNEHESKHAMLSYAETYERLAKRIRQKDKRLTERSN